MSHKLRVLQSKETPEYLQPITDIELRQTPRNAPQKDQTEALFAYGGNKYAARILDVSLGGYKITTGAPLGVAMLSRSNYRSPEEDALSGARWVFWESNL